MTTLTIAERVQRGASLLDTKFPGWVDQVDLSTLDLASGCDCILGQRFGDFNLGARMTHLSVETSSVVMSANSRRLLEDHGFLVNPRDGEMVAIPGIVGMHHMTSRGARRIKAEYEDLTREWAKLITDRRAASQLAEVEELTPALA
jgi:hypothetical protein